MCLLKNISYIPVENKGFGLNLFVVTFVRKNKRFPTKTIHQFSISEVKMLLTIARILEIK